ncbi:MAG: hypothetical protein HY904_24050 [Deltaproteobacteria bacterium]|nr:hypothetical protein [Deltaproteobacteria bacterium]
MALRLDSWDWFAAERQDILTRLWQGNVRNLLVLTGDLRSTIMASAY